MSKIFLQVRIWIKICEGSFNEHLIWEQTEKERSISMSLQIRLKDMNEMNEYTPVK